MRKVLSCEFNIDTACFVKYFRCNSAFRCSSENDDHDVLIFNSPFSISKQVLELV